MASKIFKNNNGPSQGQHKNGLSKGQSANGSSQSQPERDVIDLASMPGGSRQDVTERDRSPVDLRRSELKDPVVENQSESGEQSRRYHRLSDETDSDENVEREQANKKSARKRNIVFSDEEAWHVNLPKINTARRGGKWGKAKARTANASVAKAKSLGAQVGIAKAKLLLQNIERGSADKDSNKHATRVQPLEQEQPVDQIMSDGDGAYEIMDPEGRLSPSADGDVADVARKAAKLVLHQVKKCMNIKGTIRGQINEACQLIVKAMNTLDSREANEELNILRASNKSLKEQLAHATSEVKALRRAFSERNKEAPSGDLSLKTPKAGNSMLTTVTQALSEFREELSASLHRSIGNMVNARIDDLKSRLPPAPIARPPLASDRRNADAENAAVSSSPRDPVIDLPDDPWTPLPAPEPASRATKARKVAEEPAKSSGSTLMPPARAAPAPKAGPKKKKGATKQMPQETSPPAGDIIPTPAPRAKRVPQAATQTPPTSSNETWTEVLGRKARKKAVQSTAAAAKPAAKPKPRKLVAPSSAAIVLALKPESEATYASLLSKATTSFSLAEVGVDHVNVRKTADGARIIEVAGTDNGRAADLICEKLEGLIGNDARVYRPIKMAGLRISGIIESETTESVAAAVATKGGCKIEEVKVGAIRTSYNGTGSTLVKCPVIAANKILEGGRLLIGWTSATVQALEPAPLRCYKCMGAGHTRATCPSQMDRGSLCFRCSKPGHKAPECTEKPFCAVCHHAKKPAGHYMGGISCCPPPTKGRTEPARIQRPNQRNTDTADEGQQMEL
ncbi:uncharacterized protein LOC125226440 [Leguminivora glycinivorella]|uniref:uncharacterized protein LOC125226440 n=1 Tax=Leguminivora glycinivorella TaxID=1035111 RepID=UPI00200E223D|nr:uncharacterized protein LOC125226440 [Leguminivora glycinivorella]